MWRKGWTRPLLCYSVQFITRVARPRRWTEPHWYFADCATWICWICGLVHSYIPRGKLHCHFPSLCLSFMSLTMAKWGEDSASELSFNIICTLPLFRKWASDITFIGEHVCTFSFSLGVCWVSANDYNSWGLPPAANIFKLAWHWLTGVRERKNYSFIAILVWLDSSLRKWTRPSSLGITRFSQSHGELITWVNMLSHGPGRRLREDTAFCERISCALVPDADPSVSGSF